MAATTILLTRHAETDWNRDGRVQGHVDERLNETGRAQAQLLAERLAGETLDAVYASDLERAHETARIVAAAHGLGVTPVPDLREKHFGTWEGLTDREILLRFPEAHRGHWGDGETAEEMGGRVIAALREIAESHPAGHVLVVTHGGPLRAVLRHCGADVRRTIENCDVIAVTVDEGRFAHTG